MHIKPTATIAARQKEALPQLQSFVKELCECEPGRLAAIYREFVVQHGPRIDLYVLVPALDRFDDMLQQLVAKYSLDKEFALLSDDDASIAVAILDLSRVFIERGSNRSIYSSIPQVRALLRSANSSVIIAALNMISKLLALRYADVHPSARPAPLRELPAEDLQVFVQQQPKTIEYMHKNQVSHFQVDKSLTLGENIKLVPQGIDQTVEIVTMIRGYYNREEFLVSQFYAAAVATLMEDPNIYINSHIIDQILPTSNAPVTIKRVAYDCLRDMCFIQTQLPERKRQLSVPFANMYLVSHFSHILNSMIAGTLDSETTIMFLRLLNQSHVASSVPPLALLSLIKQGSGQYLDVQTAAMSTLYTMLMDKAGNIDAFIDSRGLDIIIETLAGEVSPQKLAGGSSGSSVSTFSESYSSGSVSGGSALDSSGLSKPSTPTNSSYTIPTPLVKVDYSLSYDRIQYFKSLFVILSNVLKRKSSPSIVARLLNTQIVHVLVTVISNSSCFGWLIVSMCIQVLSILLKQEDSILGLLLELGGEQMISNAIVWSQNPYYFPPLFHFVAALLASEHGSEIVKRYNILEVLFRQLATSSLCSYGSLNPVGRGIEDINGERPEIHHETTKLVIEFIKQVDVNLRADRVEPWVGTDGTIDHEPPKSSVVLLNVMFLLDSIFSNHHIIAVFLELRGLDALLDLICNPAIPFDLSLSKEMYKRDHAFCHVMEVLFGLESNTEYILETVLGRTHSAARRVLESYTGKLDSTSPESLAILAHVREFTILLHTFSSMAFSGSSYHTSLAIKGLAAADPQLLAYIAGVYKIAVSENANMVLALSENDLVASWPVSACFSIRYSPEDLAAIEKAKPHVSQGFLIINYVRCVLNLCFYRVTDLFTSLAADTNKESVQYRCEIESCKLADQLAEFLVRCLEVPPQCSFSAYYYRDVGGMCVSLLTSRRAGPNTTVLISFKQRGGLQKLFEVHRKILECPEPDHAIRIYLHPAVAPKLFTVFAQIPYFGLYRFLLFETETLGRVQISSDLMSGFSVPRFYLEVRILVVTGLKDLARFLEVMKPRSIIAFCDVIKMALKAPKSYSVGGEARAFDWKLLRSPEQKVETLIGMGVDPEVAKGQLTSCQNNLAEAVYRLKKSQRYPDLPDMPNVEFPVLPNPTMADIEALISRFEANLCPELIKCAEKDSNNIYFVAEPLAIIHHTCEILSQDVVKNIRLIAIMIRDAKFFIKIYPDLLAAGEALKPMALALDPFAVTIYEQILAKSIVDDISLFEQEFKRCNWTQNDSSIFLKAVVAAGGNLSPLQFASCTRLLVLLCAQDHETCDAVLASGYLWRSFEYVNSFIATEQSAFARRGLVYVYMLSSLVLETDHTFPTYVYKLVSGLCHDSNFCLNQNHVVAYAGYVYRDAEMLFEYLNQMFTPPREDTSCLLANKPLIEYGERLVEEMGGEVGRDLADQCRESLELPPVQIPEPCLFDTNQNKQTNELVELIIEESRKYFTLAVETGKAIDKDKEYSSNEFNKKALYMLFLLDLLRTLLCLHGEVAKCVLEKEGPSGGSSSSKSYALVTIVHNLLAIPHSNSKLTLLEEKVSTSAAHIIYHLTAIASDTLYNQETLVRYTERTRTVVDTLNKILINEFLNVKPSKFRDTMEWRYGLLHKVVKIFTSEFQDQVPNEKLKQLSKVPVLQSVVVEKKLVHTMSLCLIKLTGATFEGVDMLRKNIVSFFHWIFNFDMMDYHQDDDDYDNDGDDYEASDHEEPHGFTLELDSASDANFDSDQSGEIDLEIHYDDSDEHPHHHPHFEQARENPFRNSTLGMFEQNSEDEHSDEPQEYDHISDDEALSDLDEDEDEEDEDEGDFFDGEFDGIEDDFDIDAELDLSDASIVEEEVVGTPHEHHEHPPIEHGDQEALEWLDEIDSDIAFSDSDEEAGGNGQLSTRYGVVTRRVSESANSQLMNLAKPSGNDTYWLQPPLWVSPQYIEVERNSGEFTTPKLPDSDGIYIPGVDVPEISARTIAGLNTIIPRLRHATGLMRQIEQMFTSPQDISLQNIDFAIRQNTWTVESSKRIKCIKALEREAERVRRTENRQAAYSTSDSDSLENFEVDISEVPGATGDGASDGPTGDSRSEVSISDADSMEEVSDMEGEAPRQETHEAQAANPTPHIVTVGDRQLNLTEMGIDPVFLEALPENIRQEFLESSLYVHDNPEGEADDDDNDSYISGDSIDDHSARALEHLLRFNRRPDALEGLDLDELTEAVCETIPPPRVSVPNPTSKPKNGIDDWASCIDESALSSIFRQFYFAQDPIFIDYCVTFFAELSTNKRLRNGILKGLLRVFENICTGKTQQGLNALTLKSVPGVDAHRFRPIQYVQQPYENTCDLAAQTGDVLVMLFGINGQQEIDDPFGALEGLLALLDSKIVCTSTPILDWVAELIALVSVAYAQQVEGTPEVQDNQSDHSSDWEDEQGDADITIGNFEEVGVPESVPESSASAPTSAGGASSVPAPVPTSAGSAIGVSSGPAATTANTETPHRDVIPPQFISRLVSVLSSDECSSRAFRSILQALSELRDSPGVYDAIKSKTLRNGRKFRQKVVSDLKALHSGDRNELNVQVLGRFASGAAAQTKLLRLVTFIDYLLDTRKAPTRDQRRQTYSELISLFKGINFYNVWVELSTCLDLINANDFKFSTALLPLVECITVVSKHVLNAEKRQVSYSGWLRNKFTDFSLRHRKILNHLVRMNPKLLSGSFAVLSKDSRVLDFDNKLKYFSRRAIEEKERLGSRLTRLTVHRKQVFLDTYRALFYKQPNEIKTADIQVTFSGEDAVDAGGVTREWYETLSKEIFNPDYALFLPTSSGSNVFQPNPMSFVNPEHLSFFKFVGRIIGKAVYDGRVMSCYFSRAMYKCLLQRPIDLSDMEAVDQEYYKSLVWMLENDITDIITETFSVEEDKFGEVSIVDLIENGSEIPVTEENKHEYVKQIVQYKLVGCVSKQLEAISQGFLEMVPEKIRPVFLELFDDREIELLICGLPEIDLDDWRDNTSYQSYTAQSAQIKWFWTAVASFDNEQRAKLLQYATGTSKVPVGGFSQLETSSNAPKFSIVRDFGSNQRLPSAHTCTNQIDLPLYDNYQQLRAALLKAITESSSGFGFA